MKLAGAYINDETYERLVALAAANNRTLAGQCRHLYDRALKGELAVPDAPCRAPAPRQPLRTGAVKRDAAAGAGLALVAEEPGAGRGVRGAAVLDAPGPAASPVRALRRCRGAGGHGGAVPDVLMKDANGVCGRGGCAHGAPQPTHRRNPQ